MNEKAFGRPTLFSSRLSAILALTAILGLFIFPYATYGRNFGGSGILQPFLGNTLDFTGFAPEKLPDVSSSLMAGWLTLASLVVVLVASLKRSPGLWWAGLASAISSVFAIVLLKLNLNAEIGQLLSQNVPLRRIVYTSGGANLGMVLPLVSGLGAIVIGISGHSFWKERLEKLRSMLIPFVSIVLSILVGAIVILVIQSVPTGLERPLTFTELWMGKVDLVWFVYSTLFAPVTNLADFSQSLMLATPLILTGLSVAFAFRAGLFNIGAPGQMLMGGIFAMLVGVYIPLPSVLLVPLTLVAAALGGGLWGGLVGWLKARFGSSEVINTIMLNYVASSIFIFMIGSKEFSFLGKTYPLPFKAEGFEGKSHELQLGAQLPSLPQLFGLGSSGATASLGWLAGILVGLISFLFIKGRWKLWGSIGLALVATGLLWIPLTVTSDNALASSRLNVAFFVALSAALFFGIFLWRTARGYEIRVVGLSPKAAEYGGINVSRNLILAMAIAGAFAGLTAAHYVMGAALDEYRLKQSLPSNVGFDGITIALLGQRTPLGVVLSSIFFGVLDTGGLYVDQKLEALNRDIVTVLKATIVLFIAAQGFLSRKVTQPAPVVDAKAPSPTEKQKVNP